MELIFYETALAVVLMLASRDCLGLSAANANTDICLRVPFSVDKCYAASMKHPISPKSAKIDCLQRLMWYYEPDQNLTAQDQSYFSSLSQTGYSVGVPQPKTGYRKRKEYRVLSDIERQRLHNAFVKLYEKGILKKYADLHKQAIDTAHNGAGFLAWHRVFLAMFEDELRLEDNSVSLPYWDTALEDSMDNGVNSLLWTSSFLGNANGDVITGPFAGWKTSRGNLWRDYGNHPRGKLMSEKNIKIIQTLCHTDDIVFPLTDPTNEDLLDFVLEYNYNGAQNWVGGDMSDKAFAAYDPAFYMIHAFVDLQWESFRLRQKQLCGVNPETDYAVQTGGLGHGPNDAMYGFDGFRNIDGLKNYWTQGWYTYENRPQCPDCGSKYLYCDVNKNRCVSHSRRADFNVGKDLQNSWVGQIGLPTEPFEPKTDLIPKRTLSKFLPSPLSDGRTRESAKHDAKNALAVKQPVASAFEIQQPVHMEAIPQRNSNNLPFAIDTLVQNLDPAFKNNNKQLPFNVNININKHSIPALAMPHTGLGQPRDTKTAVSSKGLSKPAGHKPKTINLLQRLNQHNMQSNQKPNQTKNLNNNKLLNRRKYLSLV